MGNVKYILFLFIFSLFTGYAENQLINTLGFNLPKNPIINKSTSHIIFLSSQDNQDNTIDETEQNESRNQNKTFLKKKRKEKEQRPLRDKPFIKDNNPMLLIHLSVFGSFSLLSGVSLFLVDLLSLRPAALEKFTVQRDEDISNGEYLFYTSISYIFFANSILLMSVGMGLLIAVIPLYSLSHQGRKKIAFEFRVRENIDLSLKLKI
ncbi:MAG: hypothetical protein MJB14_01935 [Spirochaetes bacterium]|nr:hypothetical protein [Spirochaetota bacterium]